MAVTEADASMGSANVIIAILATLGLVYVVLMKTLYGTLSISEAGRTWKHKTEVEEVKVMTVYISILLIALNITAVR